MLYIRPTMSFFFLVGLPVTCNTLLPSSLCLLSTTVSSQRAHLIYLKQRSFYLRNLLQRCLRLQLERFIFTQSYSRAYVYLKNIVRISLFNAVG